MADWDVTQIGVLEHDIKQGQENSLVRIDDSHFILAYRGDNGDGFLKTFSVDDDGVISVIATLEHDTSTATYNSLAMIDSTHFILAYAGTDDDGFLKTFSIDTNYGNITQISSLEFDTSYGVSNSLVVIDPTHFAVAYVGSGSDGFIKIFSIDASYGSITQTAVLEHDTSGAGANSLLKIDEDHLLLAYRSNDFSGWIKTFSISSDFTSITQINALKHETGMVTHNALVGTGGSYYILSYSYTNGGGKLKSFYINESYAITEVDLLSHDPVKSAYASIQNIDSTHFCIAYAGDSNAGIIKVFSVDEYADSITELSMLQHETGQGSYNSIVYTSGKIILAYAGVDSQVGNIGDGFIKVFSIEGAPIEEPEDPFEPPVFENARLRIWNGSTWISATY